MAKAKTPAATQKSRDQNGKERDTTGMEPERPPESAEDFAHVLRRLVSARKERATKA